MARPVAPGQSALYDYEYTRNGTANIFMAVGPLAGWRQVTVTGQRTMRDFAAQMKQLVDACYAEAQRIGVVLDNLNTDKAASPLRGRCFAISSRQLALLGPVPDA